MSSIMALFIAAGATPRPAWTAAAGPTAPLSAGEPGSASERLCSPHFSGGVFRAPGLWPGCGCGSRRREALGGRYATDLQRDSWVADIVVRPPPPTNPQEHCTREHEQRSH